MDKYMIINHFDLKKDHFGIIKKVLNLHIDRKNEDKTCTIYLDYVLERNAGIFLIIPVI